MYKKLLLVFVAKTPKTRFGANVLEAVDNLAKEYKFHSKTDSSFI